MKYKLQCLTTNGINCKADMKLMKEKANLLLHTKGMYYILNNRWLILAIGKLREYIRKTKQYVPSCCYRFLVVLKNCLMLGLTYNEELYYHVMEVTLKNPIEEHKNVQVFDTLKCARDALKPPITQETFSQYLKSNNYPECIR